MSNDTLVIQIQKHGLHEVAPDTERYTKHINDSLTSDYLQRLPQINKQKVLIHSPLILTEVSPDTQTETKSTDSLTSDSY